MLDGRAIGVLAVRRDPEAASIDSLEIEPEFQRRSAGSVVLRRVIQQADSDGVPIRLQVLKTNPAKRLYDRFGFEVVGETTTHYVMERKPFHGPGDPS